MILLSFVVFGCVVSTCICFLYSTLIWHENAINIHSAPRDAFDADMEEGGEKAYENEMGGIEEEGFDTSQPSQRKRNSITWKLMMLH